MVQELRSTPEAQVEPGDKTADQPSADESEDPAYLNRLRRLLRDRFSLEELRVLCAELGIPHETIPGHDSMQTMPLGLVTYLKHRDLFKAP
jgi:hypothetical protein